MDLDDILQEGEVVVWQAEAPRGILLRRIDLLLIPLSLWNVLFAALFAAVLWFAENKNAGTITGNISGSIAILILFILSGYALYTVFGRFFVDSMLRSRRRYVLTERRALVVDRLPWPRWREIHLHDHVEVSVRGR